MSPSQYRPKLFWSITVANAIVCVLLLALLYLILTALAGFAAGIATWPFLMAAVLLALGTALSIGSYPIARAAPKRLHRWLSHGVNGGALLLYSALLVAVIATWLQTARRLFLVPAGFQGELYLVHDARATQSNPVWRSTYLFPKSGVLETSRKMPNILSDEYQYVYPDGHTQIIKDAGPGTLPDTPENRSNDSEVVTYFGRTAQPSAPNGCFIEEISIGTRAFLLARHSVAPDPSAKVCR